MANLINFLEKLRDRYNDPWVLQTLYWFFVDVDELFYKLWWRISQKFRAYYYQICGIEDPENCPCKNELEEHGVPYHSRF